VAETHQDVPGAVLLATEFTASQHTQYRYFRWEDYSTWDHAAWGYYGHRFNVHIPGPVWGVSTPYALFLMLHSAGNNRYHEPAGFSQAGIGIVLTACDFQYNGFTDPYTGGQYGYSKWFGRTSGGFVIPCTEDRLIDYVKLVRDDPTFNVNPNRVYVTGASMGSGSMRVAAHNPTIFAAAAASIGWINDDAWQSNAPGNATTKVRDNSGPTWANHQNMAWLASQGALPPIIHTFNKDDATIEPDDYPATLTALETYKQPFAAQWRDGNHSEFYLTGAWDYTRFLKNEAYPCFGSSTNSDSVSDQEGQRNKSLDWHSSRRSITGGSAIVDSSGSFGMSLISLAGSVTADVTIRNQQTFTNLPGASVAWADGTGSGNVTVNADGSITVPGVTIGTSAVRLTLTPASPAAAAVSARRALRRVGI
jgi:protein involved in polysaccharide export with SLBB domain